MRKKMFSLKNIAMIFMALALLTSVGCRKQDDGGKVTPEEVQNVKADLQKKLDALEKDLAAAKTKLGEYQGTKGVSQEDLNKAKAEVVALTVQKATFEAYQKANDTKVTSLESALNDLKKEFRGGLDEQIKAFQTKIDANKTELEKMLKGHYTNEQIDEKLKAMGLASSARLSGLVFVPEYVNNKETAILLFTPLKYTAACDNKEVTLSPKVIARFKVNPSTVTEADIDTDNLKVLYNDPKVLKPGKDGVSQKATFVSLKDGVLSVAIRIDGTKLWVNEAATANTDNRIDQLMLEVSPKDGEGSVVNSGWISVKEKSAIDDLELVVVDKEFKDADWTPYVVKTDLDEAKNLALDPKAPGVVDMPYNQPLDLNAVVKAMYGANQKDLDLTQYEGFSFKFDKDVKYEVTEVADGKPEPTDQQVNIKFLDDHTISAKVYGEEDAPNRATIGRTPIVHVALMNGDCKVKEGYIKLNIVDAPKTVEPTIVQEVFTLDENPTLKCNENEYTFKVGTEEMIKRFYVKYGMSKKEFHAFYKKLVQVENNDKNGFVGAIEQVLTEDSAENDPANTTFNLKWTISKDELDDNLGKVIKAKARYTNGNSIIEVVFQSNGALKQNVVSLTPTGWDKSYSYVYFTTLTPENVVVPSSNTYVQIEKHELDLTGLFELPKGKKEDGTTDIYTAEFSFADTADQPKDLVAVEDGKEKKVTFTVEGSTLNAEVDGQKQPVAEIADDKKTLKYMPDFSQNKVANLLLNQSPDFLRSFVVLKLKRCGNPVSFEINGKSYKADKGYKFDVHFLRPIAKVEVTDGQIFKVDSKTGEDRHNVDEFVTLYDWRYTVYGQGEFLTETKTKNANGFGLSYNTYYSPSIIFETNLAEIVQADGTTIPLPKTTASFEMEGKVLIARAANNALKHELTVQIPLAVNYGPGDLFGRIEAGKVTVKLVPADK